MDDLIREATRSGIGTFSRDDVRSVVHNDNKGRFRLKDGVQLMVKATQGHSFQVRKYVYYVMLIIIKMKTKMGKSSEIIVCIGKIAASVL